MISSLYCHQGPLTVLRFLKWLLLWVGVLVLIGLAAGGWWLQRPLPLASGSDAVDLTVPAGASAGLVADRLVKAGVQTPAWALNAWFRLSGESRQIQAGSYEIGPGTSPEALLDKLVRGEQALRSVTLVEGWNIRQVLAALQSADHLIDDLETEPRRLDDPAAAAVLMRRLGLSGAHPEGRFFPDTYLYPKNSLASGVLRQAAAAMDRELAVAWSARQPDLPLRRPEDLLTLASIVEKETGRAADRPEIAGVFINRLRIGMRLQTDPTVIYGLGSAFDGNLRRRDLEADTPYNTYTRAGLPPTPIALPGRAALQAAAQPAQTRAIYFVARGDGSSQFSATLDEHNRAVRQYQLGR